MSHYPAPPPTYQATGPAPNNKPRRDYDTSSPLLGSPSVQSPSGSNGFYDQPAEGDLPDDFKYGTTVSESSPEIRNAFVRKVYTILCTLYIYSIATLEKVLTLSFPSLSDRG